MILQQLNKWVHSIMANNFSPHYYHQHDFFNDEIKMARNQMWLNLRDSLRGDHEAQYQLGLCYLTGNAGIDRNYAKAVHWLSIAANHGHNEAQNILDKAFGNLAFS